MKRPSQVFASVLALLALLISCGGEVEGGPLDSGEGSVSDPPLAPTAGAQTKPSRPNGDTALGACELGFDPEREPDRDCAWLADDLCYAEKVDACACICPRNSQSSFCSSSFYQGPNGRVGVECF